MGPCLALAAAALIIVASRLGGSEEPPTVAAPEIDWFARSEMKRERSGAGASLEGWAAPPAAPALAATPAPSPLGDRPSSVAPPG